MDITNEEIQRVPQVLGDKSFKDSVGHGTFLCLDDVATTISVPSNASSSELKNFILSIKSAAFADKALTSSKLIFFGFIKHKLLKPIFFIALKVDPIFPELDVSMRIILT